jgi:hypothetical protein
MYGNEGTMAAVMKTEEMVKRFKEWAASWEVDE